jgi:hypothetical protein
LRRTVLTALAAAAFLSGGVLGNRAGAMTLAAPSALSAAAADTGLVQKAAVGCGYHGCGRVRPHHYYNYYGNGHRGRPYRWQHIAITAGWSAAVTLDRWTLAHLDVRYVPIGEIPAT